MAIPQDQLSRWVFEFKINGFIWLPGLIPEDLADAMRAQFLSILELEIELEERGTEPSRRAESRYAVSIGQMAAAAGGPLDDARARRNPLVEELVTEILGRWRYSKLIVECPCKGCGYMGWHTDMYEGKPVQTDLPKRTTGLKLQVALVDIGEENGPMEVIPGSHRMHYFEGDEMVKSLSRTFSSALLMKRGDAILRDSDLVHRGTPNRTEAPRPLYSQAYKVLEE